MFHSLVSWPLLFTRIMFQIKEAYQLSAGKKKTGISITPRSVCRTFDRCKKDVDDPYRDTSSSSPIKVAAVNPTTATCYKRYR
mmetsp:Transcript_7572/g.14000  ORF Transcript_7572/g.14000 Transcript_7572/m.14000 type:complete len:83 (-) Transcript_7572:8-256(-)